MLTNNDLVEMGWYTDAVFGGHIVFWVNIDQGHYHETDAFIDVPNGSDTHDFKIQNGNANHTWSFDYDGTSRGTMTTSYATYHTAITNSERHNGSDSLYGHFHGLRTCVDVNCPSYLDWNNSFGYYNNTNGEYHNCPLSDTEVWVKQVC